MEQGCLMKGLCERVVVCGEEGWRGRVERKTGEKASSFDVKMYY